jgi:hypothetical protein
LRGLIAAGGVDDAEMRDFDYILQSPPRGPEELFADIFAALDGVGTASIRVGDVMPNAARAVRRIVRGLK